MATPYQDRIRADGLATALTVYGNKVPVGKVLVMKTFTATIYTTIAGDYVSQTYIVLGAEINGNANHLRVEDIKDPKYLIYSDNTVVLKEGDRPFAIFEGTATSTTYLLFVSGVLYDLEEFNKLKDY